MDGGEVELSDHGLLPNPNSSNNIQVSSSSIDSFLVDFLKSSTRTCTHTHTCNPPGPDAAHTHTCHHTHTQVFPVDDSPRREEEHLGSKPRRPSGNREAVRRYREKKKAHAAYLEEEVKKLRLLNQQLTRKVQGQAILEAEVSRLRGLLLDLKGKIDKELGVFPFQAKCNAPTSCKEGDCAVTSYGNAIGLRCENEMPCSHSHMGTTSSVVINGKSMVSWEENPRLAVLDCQANTSNVCTSQAE
ncbi:hypothetical protein NMG60_11023446 [Bertholletia excelsa]